ncbi:AAA family ATPase [Billgrantia gudaonensis]|uniref:Nuclease SbcCD subunit C n=1 Tax=Billgrantia gudaonensis TaxID=376427 RepID=A0A1G8ZMJ1_9GAMM|nr:AAA family ATPase [Halomonas gudaonensis]SDK16268.1 exonuclease SbcC [Halomonas gudaonensis]
MKILALRLANLASLPGPLELDFTAPPLAEAGLFAITGPTGAGKSTLLDALCLALFGSTPRLRQAPGREAPLPDVAGETVNTADPRTLLRRGTAGGHAEVDFLCRDGRRYRARWAVRRARHKADGRLQAAEQSLTDLEDERLLTTQKREFDRLLPERLGLTFDQFTRAVLLAQSEFAAFLQADDNERSDLLERLTGTAEYSAISMAAYRRAREAKRTVHALEAKLADDLPAEPETRSELERNAEEAEVRLTDVRQEAKRLEAQQQWHATDDQLRLAYDEGYQRKLAAESEWQALAGARTDRQWRRLLAPQRHRLMRQAELPGEIATLEESHAATCQALEEAKSQQQTATERQDRAERALNEAIQARQRAEPALRQAREHAQALATLEHQLAESEKTRQEHERQAAQLAERRRRTEDEQQQLIRRRDRWQTAQRQLMGNHETLERARQAIQHDRERAAACGLALGQLASRWQETRRAEETHRQLNRRIEEDERRQARLRERGQAARQRLDSAQAHLDSVSALIERSRAVRSESVATLREGLREGDPCPVCGGLDHPWRHQPPATPEAAQLAAQQKAEDEQLTQAQQQRDQAQQERDELLGEYRALETALAQRRNDLKEVERRLADARQTLADHPQHDELAAIDAAERDVWLANRQQACEAAQRRNAETLQQLSQAEAELAPLEDELRQIELALTRLQAQQTALDDERAKLADRLPPLRQHHDATRTELEALLGDHPSPDAWQQRLDRHQEQARQARDEAQMHCTAAQQAHQRLAQQAQHEAERLARLRDEQRALERELTEWRQAHAELDDATLARLLAQPEDEAGRQEQQLDAAEAARQRTHASLAERRTALIAHRRDQRLADADTGDETLLQEEVEAEIQRRRTALDEARKALAPRLEEAQQVRDEAIHALRDDDRRRQRQQAAQAELKAARHEHRRWGRIDELIGSADGKTFRRIAQAYNLEQLLEHANLHLAGLSRRYRLIRGGSELGLLVEDRDMADERRSVHSLSGGETFLVSLALALGLASMASGELTIESLFIDEGFGSLDPQSLALAMEALDGLQALGRRVGVISHVQEMHERIPVQIQVQPEGNGTSRARLVST